VYYRADSQAAEALARLWKFLISIAGRKIWRYDDRGKEPQRRAGPALESTLKPALASQDLELVAVGALPRLGTSRVDAAGPTDAEQAQLALSRAPPESLGRRGLSSGQETQPNATRVAYLNSFYTSKLATSRPRESESTVESRHASQRKPVASPKAYASTLQSIEFRRGEPYLSGRVEDDRGHSTIGGYVRAPRDPGAGASPPRHKRSIPNTQSSYLVPSPSRTPVGKPVGGPPGVVGRVSASRLRVSSGPGSEAAGSNWRGENAATGARRSSPVVSQARTAQPLSPHEQFASSTLPSNITRRGRSDESFRDASSNVVPGSGLAAPELASRIAGFAGVSAALVASQHGGPAAYASTLRTQQDVSAVFNLLVRNKRI